MLNSDDLASMSFGCGWVENTSDLGYVAVQPGGGAFAPMPPQVQRGMAYTDAATRREQAEREAEVADAQENRVLWAQHAQRSGADISLTGFFARVQRSTRLEDRQNESRERRELAATYEPTPAEERDYQRRVSRMRRWRDETEALAESPLTLRERQVRERLDGDRELNRAATAAWVARR